MKVDNKVLPLMITFYIFVLSSFSSLAGAEMVLRKTSETKPLHTICELYKDEVKYLGEKIKVDAVFETDGINYAYFSDHQVKSSYCSRNSVMNVASIDDMPDRTVVAFFKKGDALCVKKKRALCLWRANVVFDADVLSGQGGIYLRMTHIISYTDLDP